MCSRLPASGLSRPEARWPDKVLFSAEKSGALRASGLRARLERLWCLRRRPAGYLFHSFERWVRGAGLFAGMLGLVRLWGDVQGAGGLCFWWGCFGVCVGLFKIRTHLFLEKMV